MKALEISTNYYTTKVYRNLYSELEKRLDLRIFVPLSIDKKELYGNVPIPDNVIPAFLGKSQIFGYQINSSRFSNYIIDNKISDGVNLVHAHFVFSDGSIAHKLFKNTGIPYIVSVRASCIKGMQRKIAFHNYLTGIKVLVHAEKVVFQSKSSLNNILLLLPKSIQKSLLSKYIIIPNGIDIFWHKNILSVNRIFNNKKFSIITTASIEYRKNILLVVKVIEKLNRIGYKIEYNIAGAIKDESVFEDMVKYPFVHYLGSLNQDELLKAYRQSDIFVMVSFNETFGLVYAEAMSQGLPVIYTKNEGFDKQFDEGVVGYHVAPDSPDELESAILKVSDNYQQLSKNALECVKKFDWYEIANRYYSIYTDVSK